jgi:hypothetical protein
MSIEPSPPALVTAAANLPPAADPIGARRIGCLIPKNLVKAVSMIVIHVLHPSPRYPIKLLWRKPRAPTQEKPRAQRTG